MSGCARGWVKHCNTPHTSQSQSPEQTQRCASHPGHIPCPSRAAACPPLREVSRQQAAPPRQHRGSRQPPVCAAPPPGRRGQAADALRVRPPGRSSCSCASGDQKPGLVEAVRGVGGKRTRTDTSGRVVPPKRGRQRLRHLDHELSAAQRHVVQLVHRRGCVRRGGHKDKGDAPRSVRWPLEVHSSHAHHLPHRAEQLRQVWVGKNAGEASERRDPCQY